VKIALEGAPLWQPDADAARPPEMAAYMRWLRDRGVPGIEDYDSLWRWSVHDLAAFWTSICEYFEVSFDGSLEPALAGDRMPAARWFPDARLNFAEHLLRGAPESVAVLAADESGALREVTYGELGALVGAAQQGFRALGVERGDRVVALMPNRLETLVAFIACAGMGAIWSSCSPEFGTQAVLDRFAQLEPTLLLCVGSYAYGGRRFEQADAISELRTGIPSLRDVVALSDGPSGAHPRGTKPWSLLESNQAAPSFDRVAFSHPLWVLYSSGTVGLPKGIVQGHGGILIESLKQIRLQMDVGPKDRLFWFTTTSWMMWNVVVSGLLSGAGVVLYDGSPTHPDLRALWRLAGQAGVTFMGLSASFIERCRNEGLEPAREHHLSKLRAVGSTGSPLPAAGFRWVADSAGDDVRILSMSGGTDVCSSLLSSSPLLPVYAGELQCRALGVDAVALDDTGNAVVDEVGELVVRKPMPSMPLFPWNDASGSRLRDAYFAKYPGIWCQGDLVTFTQRGSGIVHGRSDATLNRGGIRMGTSEFYRVVDAFPEILDSLIVEDGLDATSARLLLFLVLPDGQRLDAELAGRVKDAIRTQISPRHIPDEVLRAPALPHTFNGKKLEVPIKRILSGLPVAQAVSIDAIDNPEALGFFVGLREHR
jgi:acetoacetyl-CoA synthetase